MGRLFSTIYRSFFLVFSVSAVVFSVLSATSCAFVKFDHQYKVDGREMLTHNNGGGWLGDPRHRSLAGDTLKAAADSELAEDTMVVEGGVEVQAAGDASTEFQQSEFPLNVDAAVQGAQDPADEADEIAVSSSDTSPTIFASGRMDSMGNMAGFEDNPGDSAGDFGLSEDTTVGTASSSDTSPTVFPPDRMDGMGNMAGFQDSKDNSVPVENNANDITSSSATSPTEFAPDRMGGMGGMAGFKDNKGDSALDPNNVPDSAPASKKLATAVSKAAATASGDAGLYCDGDQAFSVTRLWGKSVEQLAEEIADASDRNQSEEFARGGVVMAALFGALGAFVTIFTSLTGFRVCCERWILGAVALCACVLQGITFLFFNSERYCDGDIINEILNQKPCVVGKGGYYSIAAMALYLLVVAMACRLPQDNPYTPMCNKNSEARNNENQRTFVGSGKGGDAEGASDGKPAQAPWLSQDKEKNTEENEII